MRRRLVSLLFAAALTATAPAQTVQHVVVVVQENRSPDNIFAEDAELIARGANIWNINTPAPCVTNSQSKPTLLQPYALDACFDPNHGHNSWVLTYDSGNMDGACNSVVSDGQCAPQLTYPNYSYVDNSKQIVTPYFNIAQHYGFANYMFQTNQGPSYAAHLFLFSGTSAPVYDDGDSQMYWQWFSAELPPIPQITGCVSSLKQVVEEIDPEGNESAGYTPPYPPGAKAGFPCYTHNTLATLLDNAGVSWKYYTPFGPYSLWVAPAAISTICGTVVNSTCTGEEWKTHISAPTVTNQAPILTDIRDCNLPAVSWVIPDGRWSDHPGTVGDDAGPSWVAAIVNAIGGVGSSAGCGYWANTVVLVVWDDWGGWYDHVSPATAAGGPGIGYPNQTGGQYVYGFRVPLLVVSAYAKPGYISGPASNPDCSHGNYYCHDFGSILNFIEHSFNLGTSGINPSYPYADTMAPDAPQFFSPSPYSLADFFSPQFHPFVPITGAKYPPGCFVTTAENCFASSKPSDPDKDGVDDED
jgi:phospholipase C